MKKILLAVLIIVAGACFAANVSFASLLYGINDDSDSIERFDTDTGPPSDVIATGVPDEIESLTWAGGDTYYGMQSLNYSSGGRSSQLFKFTIQGNSAVWETVGGPIAYTDIDALEYIDGSLYGIDNEQDVFINIGLDGSVISQKDINTTKIEGLAYHNGVLYGSNTKKGISESDLYSIAFNGSVTATLLGTLDFGQVESLVSLNGELYGTSDSQDAFIHIDLSSASGPTATELHEWGSDIEGTAPSQVPIPGAVWLLGSGIFALIGFRGKKRNN